MNMVDHHAILWNVKMIKVPFDYTVTQSRRINLSLGQDSECELLSIPQKNELLLILLTDRDWEEYTYQINDECMI